MKKCIRCEQFKSLDNFYAKRKYGRYGECKVCMNSRNAARMMKNKLEIVEYKGGKCEICGYNKNVKALEFHHKNPNEKDFGISAMKNSNIEKLKKEVDKCSLVCSNCHRELHDKEWRNGNTINWQVYNDILNGNMKDMRPPKRIQHYCKSGCGNKVTCADSNCVPCNGKINEKINWPNDIELEKLIWEMPKVHLAKQLGISDRAIAKRCRKRNIEQPPKGYWAGKKT